MNEPWWVLLLKVIGGPLVSGLLAAGITYWLSRRRFIGERWWDRKADAYGNIIGSLVSMIHSLNLWVDLEYELEYAGRRHAGPGKEVITSEYDKARDQIERALTEGDYVISEKASSALLELMGELSDLEGPSLDWTDWVVQLHGRRTVVKSCLEVIRAEARLDLQVK